MPSYRSYDNVLNYLINYPFNNHRLLLLSKLLPKFLSEIVDCSNMLFLIYFKINSFNIRDPVPFHPIFSNKNNILTFPANLLINTSNTYDISGCDYI